MDPAAGGGDGARPIAALAFVLGVIPGFGIGHLVAGSFGGFISWLIVDVVVGLLLFYVLPVLVFPAFGYSWTINVVVPVIERLIEGYSAYRSTHGQRRHRPGRSLSPAGRPSGDRPATCHAEPALPSILNPRAWLPREACEPGPRSGM